MNEKTMVPEAGKSNSPQTSSANVGQYVPQVFMVPYYAPPPGFNNFTPGQQPHTQMPQPVYGQMAPGMHPTPMPMPGMPPMPMTQAPMQSTNSISGSGEPPSTHDMGHLSSKMKMEEGNSNHKATKGNNQNLQQFQVPRACWSHIEEDILVKAYAEHTVGKRLRKMNKKIWESIAEQLFKESKQQLSHVGLKSWMQCKDKWNNMIKKHKYQKTDPNSEKSSIYNAIERILTYESSSEVGCEGSQSTNENVDLSKAFGKQGNAEVNGESESRHDVAEQHMTSELHDKPSHNAHHEGENLEQDLESAQSHFTNEGNEDCNQGLYSSLPSMSTVGMRKRFWNENEGNSDEDTQKRFKTTTERDTSANVDEKLCYILSRQNELLEQMHAQHSEMMQHVRISEENTRMLLVQAIKDLGTILNRLIKSEDF